MKTRYIIHRTILSILVLSLLLCGGCSGFDFDLNLDFLGLSALSQTGTSSVEVITPYSGESDAAHAYNSLTDDAVRELYLLIAEAAQDNGGLVYNGSLTEKQIAQAIIAYKNDYPQTFWIKDSYSYSEKGGNIYISLSFTAEQEELSSMKSELESAIEAFERDAPYCLNEYDRVVYVNNYITDICEYDNEAAESDDTVADESDAYGCLVKGRAVCSGYSRAFQLLCEKLGVDCVNVTGMGKSEPHQWNCVCIDGSWYNVDVTWNDADTVGLENDYLNLSDEQFCVNHTSDKLFSEISDEEFKSDYSVASYNTYVPECNETSCNYYRMTYPTLYDTTSLSSDITDALVAAAKNRENSFSVVIDDSLDFDETTYKLISEGYILNYVNSANSSLRGDCFISSEQAYSKEQIRVVTIVLNYS